MFVPTGVGLSGKVTLYDDLAIAGPALAGLGDEALVLVWPSATSETDRMRVAWSADGRTFAQRRLSAWTPLQPALASDGARLFLAWTEVTSSGLALRVVSSDHADLSEPQPLSELLPGGGTVEFTRLMTGSPALAFGDGVLYAAWRDSATGEVCVKSSSDGVVFDGASEAVLPASDFGSMSPGLFFAGGALFLADVDGMGKLHLRRSDDGGRTFGDRVTVDAITRSNPTLVGRPRPGQSAPDLTLFWVDTSASVSGPPTSFGPLAASTSFDARLDGFGPSFNLFLDLSENGLAAATFRGAVYLAWTGTNGAHHPNVARYSSSELVTYGLRAE